MTDPYDDKTRGIQIKSADGRTDFIRVPAFLTSEVRVGDKASLVFGRTQKLLAAVQAKAAVFADAPPLPHGGGDEDEDDEDENEGAEQPKTGLLTLQDSRLEDIDNQLDSLDAE